MSREKLFAAAETGDVESLKTLISQGVDVNVRGRYEYVTYEDPEDCTALHVALFDDKSSNQAIRQSSNKQAHVL